ncbi:hypothetical protein HQ520_16340 [bacterium]|nr:hypothetical protein [bacterium]
MKHLVKIFLDYDRPTLILKPEWIRARFERFCRTTHKSLMGQTFQDFEIMVVCGIRNRDLTRTFEWPEKCRPVYDEGREWITSLSDDFVALTRIDSDDLMRDDAMDAIHAECNGKHGSVSYYVFRDCLAWDMNNGYIVRFYRKAPPFVTQVFPRSIFQDWPDFTAINVQAHGKLGGNRSDCVELPAGRIMVVKHEENISDIRRDRQPVRFSQAEIDALAAGGKLLTRDPHEMATILRRFGVTP